jgi:hypothetical protein
MEDFWDMCLVYFVLEVTTFVGYWSPWQGIPFTRRKQDGRVVLIGSVII